MRNELHKTDYKRLNLGVAAAAIALTAVRVLHWDVQSTLGHLETVMQGSLTGARAPSFSPCAKKIHFPSPHQFPMVCLC